MPVIAAVVITDGTTPVTLNPDGSSGSANSFISSNKATREAQTSMKVTTTENANSARVVVKIDEPLSFINADTGRTEVIEHAIADINLRVPLAMTLLERQAFVKKSFSILSDATLAKVVKDGERLW